MLQKNLRNNQLILIFCYDYRVQTDPGNLEKQPTLKKLRKPREKNFFLPLLRETQGIFSRLRWKLTGII